MRDAFRAGEFDDMPPDIRVNSPPLPVWLARRLLRPGEQVTWVYGPRFNPSWERYVTHPALLVFALLIGAACLGLGWLSSGTRHVPMAPGLAGAGIVLGSIFVLAISSGYFTRL